MALSQDVRQQRLNDMVARGLLAGEGSSANATSPARSESGRVASAILLGVPDLVDCLDRPLADAASEVLENILVQVGTCQTLPCLLCGHREFLGHG